MLLSALLLILGLALLVGGAEWLVRGVSGVAAGLGVPTVVIGLTVVAFGTSTPELVVNLSAAAGGRASLAFGNIVGSCLLNVGVVLGVTAVVRPTRVGSTVVSRELPMLLLAAGAFAAMGADGPLDGVSGGAAGVIGRTDGVVLLLLFGGFLYYTILTVISRRPTDALVGEARGAAAYAVRRPVWRDVLYAAAGIAAVAVGGEWTVGAASAIARSFGVGEDVIGLTILSFGTTLPELATSITAVRRGQDDLSVGNVVGSCIYNLLFIGGAVAVVRPIAVPRHGLVDLLVLVGFCAALLPVALLRRRRINRAEGAALVVAYLVYFAWRTTAG